MCAILATLFLIIATWFSVFFATIGLYDQHIEIKEKDYQIKILKEEKANLLISIPPRIATSTATSSEEILSNEFVQLKVCEKLLGECRKGILK